MTMKLSTLPPELIGLILNGYSHSFLVIDLWNCGDLTLHKKLSAGLTHLYLERRKAIPYRLPSVVYHLTSLRYLSVISTSWLMYHPMDWIEARSKLPKSLETLKLLAWDTDFVFMNFAPEWTLENHQYIESDYPLGKSRFIDIEALLPNLRKLKLRRFESYDHLEKGIHSRDLPGLPSKLTQLTTYVIDAMHIFPLVLSKLPRSLTCLKAVLNLSWFDEDKGDYETEQPPVEDWMGAPPHLEQVDRIYSLYPTQNDLSWLPRSLTMAELILHTRDDSWSLSLSKTVPPIFKRLCLEKAPTFEANGVSFVSSLPSSLTILEAYHADPDSFKNLVKLPLLKELRVSGQYQGWNDLFDESFSSTNLPALETLRVSCATDFAPLHNLPATIRHLTFSMARQWADEHILVGDKLPPNLTELWLDFAEFGKNDLTIIGPLPSKLTTLHLMEDYSEFGLQVNRHGFEALPASLTELDILISGIENPDDPWTIPPNLRSFTVSRWHIGALKALPSKLTYLNLFDLVEGCNDIPSTETFSYLPQGIEHLKLGSTKYEACYGTLSGDCFSTLKHLRTLSVLISRNFDPSILKHLPRNMYSLRLPLKSFSKTHDLPFVSPQLVEVNFHLDDEVRKMIRDAAPWYRDVRFTPMVELFEEEHRERDFEDK